MNKALSNAKLNFDVNYRLPVYKIRNKIFTPVAGKILNNPDSIRILERYKDQLEVYIKKLCSGHSFLYWLSLARRIAPEKIEEVSSTAVHGYRNVLTAAILKYGETKYDDVCFFKGESMTRGGIFLPTEYWSPKIGISEKPGVYITIYQIEYLCLEFYRTCGGLRRVFKGERLKISNDLSPLIEKNSKIDDLIDLYDRRHKNSSIFTKLGVINPIGNIINNSNFPVMAFQLNIECENFELLLKDEKKDLNQTTFKPNYIPVTGDLEGYYKLLKIFETDLIQATNLRPEEIVCFFVIFSIRLGYQYFNFPTARYGFLQRAFLMSTNEDELVSDLAKRYSQFYRLLFSEDISFSKSKNVVRKCIKFFTGDLNSINLWDSGPLPVFIKINKWILIDYSAIPTALINVLATIPVYTGYGQRRGKYFEEYVSNYFKKQGFKLWICRKELKVLNSNQKKEIDVSFMKDDSLIIIGCRSHYVTKEYGRGKPSDLDKRWKIILEGIRDVESKCSFIFKKRKEKLSIPIPKGIKYIIPVLCVPYADYIPSKSGKYFLWKDKNFKNSIPRVCTPEELSHFFRDFNYKLLRNKPYTLAL